MLSTCASHHPGVPAVVPLPSVLRLSSSKRTTADDEFSSDTTPGSLPSHNDISIRILVSIPPTYPSSSPPQLQLLSRYIGAFGVDSSLFGSILRTFISVSGVEWTPEVVCVFDGLQNVLERCEAWYEDKLNRETAGELLREDTFTRNHVPGPIEPDEPLIPSPSIDAQAGTSGLPEDIKIVEAEPIVDRKSIFVGRACRISHPSQV